MGLPLRQGEGTAAASASTVNWQKIQGLLVVHECYKMQSCHVHLVAALCNGIFADFDDASCCAPHSFAARYAVWHQEHTTSVGQSVPRAQSPACHVVCRTS